MTINVSKESRLMTVEKRLEDLKYDIGIRQREQEILMVEFEELNREVHPENYLTS